MGVESAITIKIPYTSGRGSYSGFTATQISAVGQGGDENMLTLAIPPGIYNNNGTLTAEITIGGADTEYLIEMLQV